MRHQALFLRLRRFQPNHWRPDTHGDKSAKPRPPQRTTKTPRRSPKCLWHKLLMTPSGAPQRMMKMSPPTSRPLPYGRGSDLRIRSLDQSPNREGGVARPTSIFEEGSCLVHPSEARLLPLTPKHGKLLAGSALRASALSLPGLSKAPHCARTVTVRPAGVLPLPTINCSGTVPLTPGGI